MLSFWAWRVFLFSLRFLPEWCLFNTIVNKFSSQRVFNIVREPGSDQTNEEEEFIVELMEDNMEMTKLLWELMEKYTMAQIQDLKLKTELATEWTNLRRFYASHFDEDNDENNSGFSNLSSAVKLSSIISKKIEKLRQEEKHCDQVSVL